MTLTPGHRETFRQACGLFLPQWRDMPDAASLGIEFKQLDQALRARTNLLPPLVAVLEALGSQVSPHDLERLKTDALPDFLLLRTIICGAYYLHPAAKSALGYSGQQALTLPRGGFGAEDLVMKMMEQPKRYRDAD